MLSHTTEERLRTDGRSISSLIWSNKGDVIASERTDELSINMGIVCVLLCVVMPAPEEKAEPPQTMNALMRLNQLKPGLQYKLVSQTGPVHVPVFTMAVEVDGTTFEASGPSKRTAKLHVAVKVSRVSPGIPPVEKYTYFKSEHHI